MNTACNISDLPTASYLYASGIPLIGIHRVNAKRCDFLFKNDLELNKLIQDFASGREVLMIPSHLLASHKHLKSLLWSQR